MLSRKGQRVKGNLQLYYYNNNYYYLSLLLLLGAHRNFTAKKLGRGFFPNCWCPTTSQERQQLENAKWTLCEIKYYHFSAWKTIAWTTGIQRINLRHKKMKMVPSPISPALSFCHSFFPGYYCSKYFIIFVRLLLVYCFHILNHHPCLHNSFWDKNLFQYENVGMNAVTLYILHTWGQNKNLEWIINEFYHKKN